MILHLVSTKEQCSSGKSILFHHLVLRFLASFSAWSIRNLIRNSTIYYWNNMRAGKRTTTKWGKTETRQQEKAHLLSDAFRLKGNARSDLPRTYRFDDPCKSFWSIFFNVLLHCLSRIKAHHLQHLSLLFRVTWAHITPNLDVFPHKIFIDVGSSIKHW